MEWVPTIEMMVSTTAIALSVRWIVTRWIYKIPIWLILIICGMIVSIVPNSYIPANFQAYLSTSIFSIGMFSLGTEIQRQSENKLLNELILIRKSIEEIQKELYALNHEFRKRNRDNKQRR